MRPCPCARLWLRAVCPQLRSPSAPLVLRSASAPYMRRASAVVVESTNPECHAAVACQAMGIPMMMDRSYQAVHMLKSGMMITVDANEGFIYNGIKA